MGDTLPAVGERILRPSCQTIVAWKHLGGCYLPVAPAPSRATLLRSHPSPAAVRLGMAGDRSNLGSQTQGTAARPLAEAAHHSTAAAAEASLQ